jgi:uncharacterized protein HemX
MTEPAAAEDDGSSALPILAALAIVVVILIAIGVFTLTRGDGLTEQQRVGRAAVAQNDALQRENYANFRASTCAAVRANEADVLAAQRASTAKKGARYVDDVTGVAIDGDRASGTVVYHFEKAQEAKINAPMTFVREGGSWKVCSPGPS